MPSFSLDMLNRSIFKFIYKLSFPKTHKHNRRFWPYYRVERNSEHHIQKVIFKKQIVAQNTVTRSKNCKLMLVATGPSLNQLSKQDLTQTDIDYMGVNGAISCQEIHFKYYVIIDHNFVMEKFDLVKAVLNTPCTLFTTPRCLDLILRKMNFSQIKSDIKVLEVITRNEIEVFLNAKKTISFDDPNYYIHEGYGFSKNIFHSVFDYFTVAYVALQIGVFLKYPTIFLAGLDMNNFSQPRFYETKDNQQPTLLDLHQSTVLNAFALASKYMTQNHIEVINLSPSSAIENFTKYACLADYDKSKSDPLK